MPAQLRHIRRGGLLPCCIESVHRSHRPTVLGSQLQCGVCEATLVVDEAGAWTWTGRSGPAAVAEPPQSVTPTR